jgi:hypothetical protein
MLATLVLLLLAPRQCTDVKRECRTCTVVEGKRRCSNIGIACQPTARLCYAREKNAPVDRPKVVKRSDR